jgi:integrase/recombinase XerD
LVARAGERAAWCFLEFFTANIRNKNIRAAYAQACGRFFDWCDERGFQVEQIQPVLVASYIESLQNFLSAPSVKQDLAAIRMLFDWLILGQVIPMNAAAAVRGPKHVVNKGKTPVLKSDEARQLLDSIRHGNHRGSPRSPWS